MSYGHMDTEVTFLIMKEDLKDEKADLKNEITSIFLKKDFNKAILDYNKLKYNN